MEKVLACPLDRVNCRVDICISLRAFRNFARGGGGGGGTPSYKLYRYVPSHLVGFLRRFGLKPVYTLPILVWNRVWFSRELRCV